MHRYRRCLKRKRSREMGAGEIGGVPHADLELARSTVHGDTEWLPVSGSPFLGRDSPRLWSRRFSICNE